MNLIFSPKAWEDYIYWQDHDPKLSSRLNGLIKEASRTPFQGTGKPEPLKGPLAGWWSRRLTQEHRLVYRPTETGLQIAQCRNHY
jgi:toxin YoeB